MLLLSIKFPLNSECSNICWRFCCQGTIWQKSGEGKGKASFRAIIKKLSVLRIWGESQETK